MDPGRKSCEREKGRLHQLPLEKNSHDLTFIQLTQKLPTHELQGKIGKEGFFYLPLLLRLVFLFKTWIHFCLISQSNNMPIDCVCCVLGEGCYLSQEEALCSSHPNNVPDDNNAL